MNKKRIFISSGAVLCFAFIAFMVMSSMETGQPLVFDTLVRDGIMGLRNSILNPVLISITYLGNSETIILFCIVLLFFKKTRMSYGMPLAITASLSATLQTIIKISIQRARPPVENFLISQGGFSFPSGHSCTGLVFYGLLAYLVIHTNVDNSVYKVVGRACIGLFLLIGFSRIYLGVHYPTDVLAGWALGTAVLMVAISLIDWLKINEKANVSRLEG